MTIQNVPSKGRISIIRIQNFTIQRRHSVIPLVYGTLLVIIATILASINPLERITDWFLDIKKGSFIYNMWESPTYELYAEVWVFNYTNVPEYLSGQEKVLRLDEIGPFRYKEKRTNWNITVDSDEGTMKMKPNIELSFLRDRSIAEPKDVNIFVPNIALIAISTLAADKLGYFANAGAYYSMTALGSKLFMPMTVDDFFWGYYDPIVSIAHKILPGWIDFGKIGIMDRFYGIKIASTEVQIKDTNRKYAIEKWDDSEGLTERGFINLNESTLCTRIKGSYEGLMVSPKQIAEKMIPIFRKQACRVFPFTFQRAIRSEQGFDYHRFSMKKNAFNRTSEYACQCKSNCLPDGFVDISSCYYGFPIALSKPHFMDVDPDHLKMYEGMKPDVEKHDSVLDLEPNIGVPLALSSKVQVNVAVRMSPGNPITKPVKDKVLPLMWVSLFCEEAPPLILNVLRLRFVIAPPLLVTVEVLLFIIGLTLGAQGSYRLWRPKYKIIEPSIIERPKRSKSSHSIILNMSDNRGFKDDEDDLAKEAVSLLAIREEDSDTPDLIMSD